MGMELSFYPPDMKRYPCLKLAIDALIQGGSAPLVFNAANEMAVDAFLANRIGFAQISSIIDRTLTLFEHRTFQSLNDLLTLDNEARILAEQGIVQVA
jgi:1-deoxy-D-xylulose-5-phosphate reductoisomerase